MHQANPGAPKKVELAIRRRDAILLRMQGATYQQVADGLREAYAASDPPMLLPLKYDFRSARRDVMAGLETLYDEIKDEAKALIALNRERIAALFAKMWPRALNGDYAAFDRVLALMSKEEALLGVNRGNGLMIAATAEAGEDDDGTPTAKAQVLVYLPDNGRGDTLDVHTLTDEERQALIDRAGHKAADIVDAPDDPGEA